MKKLLALLLVLVMVIALVPTAVAAAEADGAPAAPAAEENPETPANPQNPESPENSQNPENPHDGHDIAWSWGSTTHCRFCLTCGEEISADEPHTFDSTSHKCTVCGAPDPNHCDHKNVDYIPAGSEGHIKYCTDCSTDLGDVEPHHKVGNRCDLCGYDKFDCTHEHTTWGYNDEYHHLTCDDCYDIIDSGEHVGMDDGICDKCGYNVNTTHHFPPNSHNCSDPGCGYRSFCSDEDGDCKCDICGTEVHDWAICKDLDDNSHEWFCSKCKKSLGKAPHVDINDGGDGKCDGCGHKMSGGSTEKDPSLDNVPKTADVMAPVAILSGLMSVAAVFTKKRFF